MASLVLVVNPGSASRKYALYDGDQHRLSLHFEYDHDQIFCTTTDNTGTRTESVHINDLNESTQVASDLITKVAGQPQVIALRVVAPSSDFLEHKLLDEAAVTKLGQLQEKAPLHIEKSLSEWQRLRQLWPQARIVAISDSAFHASKLEAAWHYGISLEVEKSDIKRFGYHGISVESVVSQLQATGQLLPRAVVCHLGSGSSVTAIAEGKSQDTTMGYSPLEGVVMATRSGSIDLAAARAIKQSLHLDDEGLEHYLSEKSGLLGLSGASADIRVLIEKEATDKNAALALSVYVYKLQQAIGQMSATLGGVDSLVFTGTVGERSAIIRERVLKQLSFLGFEIDVSLNSQIKAVSTPTVISKGQKPVIVVPAQEEKLMALIATKVATV